MPHPRQQPAGALRHRGMPPATSWNGSPLCPGPAVRAAARTLTSGRSPAGKRPRRPQRPVTWLTASAGRDARDLEDLSSQEVCSVPEITPGSQPVLPYPGPGRLRQVITTQPGRA